MRPLQIGTLGITRPPAGAIIDQARALEEERIDAVWYSDHFLHWFPPGVCCWP